MLKLSTEGESTGYILCFNLAHKGIMRPGAWEAKSNKFKLYKMHAENHGTDCHRIDPPPFKDSTLRFDVFLKDAL